MPRLVPTRRYYELGVVSAEALATVNVRVITKLHIYIDKKERQRPEFNYLELNQINTVMVYLIY